MNIAADTNVLLRVLVNDDPRQASAARAMLDQADKIAIGNSALCELVWVLSRAYRRTTSEVGEVIRGLASAEKVVVDRDALEAGLALANAGGDFPDGVIAFEGRKLGGETFVSFDRQAVRLLQAAGENAKLL